MKAAFDMPNRVRVSVVQKGCFSMQTFPPPFSDQLTTSLFRKNYLLERKTFRQTTEKKCGERNYIYSLYRRSSPFTLALLYTLLKDAMTQHVDYGKPLFVGHPVNAAVVIE